MMKTVFIDFLKAINRFGVFRGSEIIIKKISKINNEFSVNLFESDRMKIRRDTSDWSVFKQIFLWNEYNYPFGFDAEYIIDAGANVGYAAIWFSNRFPGAKIISIEPEESNFRLLNQNVRNYKNVSTLKAGLWSHSGKLAIIDHTTENWGFITKEVAHSENTYIDAYNVEAIMEKFRLPVIDILKMDVEGAEKTIFESDYDSWLPYTRCLIIEVHDEIDKGCSKALFKAMINYSFTLDILGENLYFFNNNIQRRSSRQIKENDNINS